ncbi:MAG: hypothetical protein KGL39_17875 [Patescibacteria group bacterium]|nr:hypothetical protein [Patescibacteria group bacterium]
MNNVAVAQHCLPSASSEAIAKVSKLVEITAKMPQTEIETFHLLHAGMYARTITIPKGVLLTGALIKIATILIISGDVVVYIDDKPRRLSGYQVIAGSARRKQAFYAIEDTSMTMLFKTDAKTIKEAEEQFTDEAHLLFSRHSKNNITITGES